jgi:hypothetical protein
VRLRGPRTSPVKVNKTADRGATAGSDYDVETTLISIVENQKTVSVTVRGDRLVELNEVFFASLAVRSAPRWATRFTGTIRDDDNLGVGVPEPTGHPSPP